MDTMDISKKLKRFINRYGGTKHLTAAQLMEINYTILYIKKTLRDELSDYYLTIIIARFHWGLFS